MLVSLLLFLIAAIGHGYLLMLSLNVTFSYPFHQTVLKAQRLLWGLLLLAGPIAFALFVGVDRLQFDQSALANESKSVVICYAWLCIAAGIAFLLVTAWRLRPQRPKVILDERTITIDVEKELGRRPVGDGKYRKVAGLRWLDLFNVEYTTLTLQVPGLPTGLNGLTILHISDLHFYGTPDREYFEFVVQNAMTAGIPDIFVLSGDIIDHDKYLKWIEPVLSPLRWKVSGLAILGNHDWWKDFEGVRERLAKLGMHVISNRWTSIDVRGERLIAIGHEGPWFRPSPDLTNCPEGFRLLVSHTPDNIGWAKRNNCQLMLSGHNHGGQIRLPIFGSLFVPSFYSRRYDMGTFHEPPTVLHVNRGLSGKQPVRFRCRPQVSRIVLRCY